MIELTFMDKDYQVQGFLDQFTSLVWTRRYYDIGEFELHAPLADFPLLKQSRLDVYKRQLSICTLYCTYTENKEGSL